MTVLSAYITNLGKYNEGELLGQWHGFPTTKEKIKQTFEEIGIDGVQYEEFFITDYDSEINGILEKLGEYASIDELNYLASKLEDMNGREIEIYEAALEAGDFSADIQKIISLIDNLHCFDYVEGVIDDYDLGHYWVEESGCYDTESMGPLANYIDYERFGSDIRLDEGGAFVARGYIRNTGDAFIENYDGINVPEEYRVFALPKQEPLEQAVLKQKIYRDRGVR
jgi:hypothetical protein